mmetsp:Transcript_26992/g.40154  ORF Transcript_26992/g.40154 Transcript_26992/m.40154 type:complete len:98 (+) Transcript_26992:460-753(+)
MVSSPHHPQASLPTSTLYRCTKTDDINSGLDDNTLSFPIWLDDEVSLILSRRLSLIGVMRQKLFLKLPGMPSHSLDSIWSCSRDDESIHIYAGMGSC